MEYKGWIPTVTGRLSFDFFGDSNCPSEAISQNVSDSAIRYAIIYQKRYLSDATLPFKHWTSQHLFHHKSTFWCACLGCSPEEEIVTSSTESRQHFAEPPLVGRLFIFNADTLWSNVVEKQLVSSQKLLAECCKKNPMKIPVLRDTFDAHYRKLDEFLCERAIFCANYELSRNGVLRITIDNSLIINPDAPRFPEDLRKRKHLQHIVCSQLFFFLRDIGHRHQHHYPTTDTIIDLYTSENDDLTWRIETLRSLCRKAVEFKRSKRYELYSSALGVLAYIKSFQNINYTEKPKEKVLPGFNVVALEKGINAAIQSYNYYSNQINARNDKIRNVTLAIFGLLFSFIGLYKLTNIGDIQVSDQTKGLVCNSIRTVLDNPIPSILFTLVSFGLFSLSIKLIDVYRFGITRDLQRMFVTMKKGNAIIISTIISILFGFFTYWFVFKK